MAMDHIKQYDWCSSEPDVHFIKEADIDNSVTEKILKNKFLDPLLSSESEDESEKIKINWDEVLKNKRTERKFRLVVHGIHPPPPFPKLSALTTYQHIQCLKVLCAEHPNILPAEFMARPAKRDIKVFEEVKEIYAKEQKEFIEWAKTLWTNSHCVRALRPKPPIEMVYEAEFKVTAHKMQSFPKRYSMAGQIPLEIPAAKCEMVLEKELVEVNIKNLPKITLPEINGKTFIMKPYPVPEPCNKHPCRFYLPSEASMTILPLTEVHTELAQFAIGNGVRCIISEEALRCLVEIDENWLLPISVCQVVGEDGPVPVVVIDGDFANQRESPPVRTQKAFRRLLEHTLVPPIEVSSKRKYSDSSGGPNKDTFSFYGDPELTDDEDDDNLYIDTDACDSDGGESELKKSKKESNKEEKAGKKSVEDVTKADFYSCTCKDSFDKPPPRSYKKWKVVNSSTNDSYSFIVHCPHRVRDCKGELVLEPLAEYQLDTGARRDPPRRAAARALALALRGDAAIYSVRIDGSSGEIVTTERLTEEKVVEQDSGAAGTVSNTVFAVLDQLQGLLPGHYVLQHEEQHGSNAILLRPAGDGRALQLTFDCSRAPGADDAKCLGTPPTLAPVLLPIHKYRRTLPCAFTPYPDQVAKEAKRAAKRQKTPPQAIKWPKKKNKKKKKNNNNN